MKQTKNDILDVLSDIARFSQASGIRDSKGNLEKPRQRLRQQCFSGTGGSQEKYIALLQLHIPRYHLTIYALVMVMNGDSQNFFRPLLANNVLI